MEWRMGWVEAVEDPIPPITREFARRVLLPLEGRETVLFEREFDVAPEMEMVPAELFMETLPSWERSSAELEIPPPRRKSPLPATERLPFVNVAFVDTPPTTERLEKLWVLPPKFSVVLP